MSIAVKSPVELAIEPLKAEAIAYAEDMTQDRIAKVLAELAAMGGDAEVYAPYPRDTRVSRNVYLAQKAKHDFVAMVTKSADDSATRRWNAPDIRVASPERIAKVIDDAKADAALQYDAFVAKLNAKVGACDTATLVGSHIWGYSVLTVTKGEATEFWKTQQIVNVSKLGTHYLQWPSRKVKGPF
jgi:hypothetical protein